jgi:N-acetylneuraminic acid mutarotase
MILGRDLVGFLAFGTAVLHASAAAAQGWQPVDSMPTARAYHAGAVVADLWYVAGGARPAGGGQEFPAEVHVYDPATSHWTVLGQLAQGRQYILAVPQHHRHRVLFPAGFVPEGPDAYLPLATCDIASSQGVVPAPSLLGARHLHAAALAAGRLVASGGWGIEMMMGMAWSKLLDNAESWDGASTTWLAAGRMPGGARAGHTMTTLQNGRELLVVGGGRPDRALSDVDLFDAECGTWARVAPLMVARARHKALRLRDGRVLVAGGFTYPPTANNVQTSAEIFDPATREWKAAGPMNDPRFDFDMVPLPDGRVLAAGGSNNATDGEYGALSSAEVYDPTTDTWTPLSPMRDRRRWPALAVLSDGVYVAGGSFSSSTVPGSATVLASVERLAWSELGITVSTNSDGGFPGESLPDAGVSCGMADGSVSPDGDPGDASAIDTDTGPRDRESGGGSSGCSCQLARGGTPWDATWALACVVFAAVVCRRSRQRL